MSVRGPAVDGFSRRTSVAVVALLVAIAAIVHGSGLRRTFTAEDFLLVRFLGEHPPWREPWLGFAGPWLGVTAVGFWRPLATLAFAVEVAAFGASPVGYQLVSLALHTGVALLLAAWVRRLAPGPGGAALAVAVGAAFLAHPSHPNAVQFPASFATLWGGAAIAAGLLAWERERGSASLPWRTLACYLAGLASYEAAVVLPGMLVARELLLADRGERARLRWIVVPCGAVLAAYLGVRVLAVGAVLGGYAETRGRILGAIADLGGDLATAFARLAWPLAAAAPAPRWCVAVMFVAAVAVITLSVVGPFRRAARGVGFALVVVVLAFAPTGFQPVVPATGRYLYVATFGGALVVAAAALAAGVAARRRAAIATLVLAAVWSTGLATTSRYSHAGSELAARIGAAVTAAATPAETPAGAPSPAPRLFVTGYPLYLTDAAGTPVAPVLHYGLRDLAGPPFQSPRADVYPAPDLADEALAALADLPGARVVRWNGSELVPVSLASVLPIVEPVAAGRDADGSCRLQLPTATGVERQRLVLVAAGNATVVEAPAGTPLAAPGAFVQTMRRLYPDLPIYGWVLGESGDGGAVVRSSLFELPDPDAGAAGAQNRSPSPCE